MKVQISLGLSNSSTDNCHYAPFSRCVLDIHKVWRIRQNNESGVLGRYVATDHINTANFLTALAYLRTVLDNFSVEDA